MSAISLFSPVTTDFGPKLELAVSKAFVARQLTIAAAGGGRQSKAVMKVAQHALYISVFIVTMLVIGACETPTKVTVCELKRNPSMFDHKLIEVTGFVSSGFEEFTLAEADSGCDSGTRIWLEYGGKSKSVTAYCCEITTQRPRLKESIPIPLVVNDQLMSFEKVISRADGRMVIARATIIGRFFAGRKLESLKWGGYGHMGCCTLLAIQEVKSVDTENRR